MPLPHDRHMSPLAPHNPDLQQRELRLRLDEARSRVTLLEQELARLQQCNDQRGPGQPGFPLPIAAG